MAVSWVSNRKCERSKSSPMMTLSVEDYLQYKVPYGSACVLG